jgi:hypothetical protein
MKTEFKTIEQLIEEKNSFISAIPNNLGINLSSVKGIEYTRQEDKQLTELKIVFIPMKELIEKEINSILSDLEHIMLTSENIQDTDNTTYQQLIWTKQDIHRSILNIKEAIQSLTQEPSAVNAEEVLNK